MAAGADPQNRANLWNQVRQLRDSGTTVFLTTHYLDEADQLSDRLAIIDRGHVIAEGTPAQLKQRYSGDTIVITPAELQGSLAALEQDLATAPFIRSAQIQDGSIRLSVTDATRSMAAVFSVLAAKGIAVGAASLRSRRSTMYSCMRPGARCGTRGNLPAGRQRGASRRAGGGMIFALQSELFFRRKLLETLRQPVWVITGLSTPLLYLALFEPLLRSVAGGNGVPAGHVLDVFVPGILTLMAFGAGMGAGGW